MTTGHTSDLDGRRVLLGVTGGIAAYKTAELVRLYRKAGADVRVIMTPAAERFVTKLTLGTLSENEVHIELFPENLKGSWTKHVSLGLWADIYVIAPATAQTISKLVSGMCDSMVTAVALSARCPMLVCPAMDHDMYEHPASHRNREALREAGAFVMEAEHGELASGLIGKGRLPEPAHILADTFEILDTIDARRDGPLAGKKVLVSAGPTRESLDPVRFISNRSTGTMGFELARSAARRGADVVLVAGPVTLETPEHVRRVDVVSTADMHEAVSWHADADIVVMAAAVADFTPARPSDSKIKKAGGAPSIDFASTTDILAELGQHKREGQILVGFALETDDGPANARKKLERKNLDWIVLNSPVEEGAGFGPGTNRVDLIPRDGETVELPVLPKAEVAEAILEHVLGRTDGR